MSSRSHFVARLFVGGLAFTLVDLAGSERKKDSDAHTKARQQEGAEINASLHALKECIRAQGKAWAPYRNSPLTRVLQESLAPTGSRECAKLAVIATVSPAATDIEHSISTLQVAHMLSGRAEKIQTAQSDLDPHSSVPRTTSPCKWSHEELCQWIAGLGAKFAGFLEKLPEHVDGKALSRWTAQRYVQLAGEKLGQQLYDQFVDANKRASMAQKRERQKRKAT